MFLRFQSIMYSNAGLTSTQTYRSTFAAFGQDHSRISEIFEKLVFKLPLFPNQKALQMRHYRSIFGD